jgi:hypothetical protein
MAFYPAVFRGSPRTEEAHYTQLGIPCKAFANEFSIYSMTRLTEDNSRFRPPRKIPTPTPALRSKNADTSRL